MKKSRFSDSQIMGVLKQAQAGMPVPELCREHGISSATFYKWRAKWGLLQAQAGSLLHILKGNAPGSTRGSRTSSSPVRTETHCVRSNQQYDLACCLECSRSRTPDPWTVQPLRGTVALALILQRMAV